MIRRSWRCRRAPVLAVVALGIAASPLWGQAGGAARPAAPTVYVPDVNLSALPAADAALREQQAAYTDAFAYAVNSGTCSRLETAADARRRLANEAANQLLGTDVENSENLARVAKALGADRLATASVGKLGTTYVVTATLLDPREARAVARASAKASSASQVAAALRTVGRQLAQALGGGAPANTMLTARYRGTTWARGSASAAMSLEGTTYITADAIRSDFGGDATRLLSLAMLALAGDTTAVTRALTGGQPPKGGLWILTRLSTGETTVVDEGSRTVLPLATDATIGALGQYVEAIGTVTEAVGEMGRLLGREVGFADKGKVRLAIDKIDVGATRIQDSVWIGLGDECPTERAEAAAARPGGLAGCVPGRTMFKTTAPERTQWGKVNGYTVEHWQVRNEMRGRMEGGADVPFLKASDRRIDSKVLMDFWVPRGAGFCLPVVGTGVFDPFEKSLAAYDKMLDARLAEDFRRAMAALRSVPGGATRTVVRDYANEVDAPEPAVISQSDIFDVKQVPLDPARFRVPADYRRLTLPAPPARSAAAAGAGDAAGAGTKGEDGKAEEGKGESLGDKAARAAKDEAKGTVEEAKAEAKAEVRSKVDEAKAKAKEAVTGRFKGLLKKPAKDSGGR